MPRPKKWPPTVHHDPTKDTDYIKLTVNGKRRTHSLGPHDSPEARAEYLRVVAEVERGGIPTTRQSDGAERTVMRLIASYLPHARDKYERYEEDAAISGQMRRVQQAVDELQRLYGHVPIEQFGPKSLATVRAEFVKKGWSRNYITACVGCLKTMFRWGVSEELVPEGIWRALTTLPPLARDTPGVRESEEVTPVADAVVAATLPHLNPIVADMVRLQQASGMRGGEVCRLRPCDISREGEVAGFGRFPGVWVYELDRHKNRARGKRRIVFLGAKAQKILTPYLAREPEAFCFAPQEASDWHYARRRSERKTKRQPSHLSGARRVGPDTRERKPGLRYTSMTFARAVARAAERADAAAREQLTDDGLPVPEGRVVPHWHPHQLRHAAGTVALEAGGIEDAGALLGHSDLGVTARYASTIRRAAEVAARIG